MKTLTFFDVLIVYTDAIATSAKDGSATMPFSVASNREHYNNAYAYLLKTCQKHNLKAAFTTSADIIDSGICKNYWLFENNTWIKFKEACFSSFIFDKFSPINKIQKKNGIFCSVSPL